MRERQTCIVMFEGPQGSGKTTASKHLSRNGYRAARGIPTGEQLILNSEAENWHQSLQILSETVNSPEDSAMDRSFWSLVVYNMRKKPERAELIYTLGKSLFERRIGDTNYCIAILESDPETCLRREDKTTEVAIKDIAEAEQEHAAYEDLACRLTQDGLSVIKVSNKKVTKLEFLTTLEKLFED